jgi:hypothetical protein
MGTRGFIVVKLRSKWFRIYNHTDSGPESLGQAIISRIRRRTPIANKSYAEYLLDVSDRYEIEEVSEMDIKATLGDGWVYVIDLNKMTLSINGGYYEPTYALDVIPEDCIKTFIEMNDWYSENR